MQEILNKATMAPVPEPIATASVLTEDTLAEVFEAKREEFLTLIRRYLSPKLQKRVDPEGVLHDAFIRARKRKDWLSTSPKSEQLAQNLDRIVFEQTIDVVRRELGATRNADREVHIPDESVAQLAMGLYRSQSTPSKAMARKEAIALVRHALNQLEAIDKRIVLWRTEFNLAYEVIGQILEPEMAENAVNQRYRRALKKLGKLLPPLDSIY